MTAFYERLAALAQAGSLPASFAYPFIVRGVIAVLVLGPLLGGMSHLVVARRLAFLSTAIGQAALTGLTIGLVLGEPLNAPSAGIFGFCLLSAVVMVYVKRRTALPTDTLIGVFLSMTLGLGICLLVAVTKRFNIHQIEAVMFGSLLTVTDADLALLVVLGVAVGGLLAWRYNAIMLDSLSPPLARVSGFSSAALEYLFVVLLTVAIVTSLKVIGALLVEALVIVPAASGRNLARSMRSYLLWSVLTAIAAGLGGLALSTQLVVPSGGAVVLALAALFFVTLAISAGGRAAPVSMIGRSFRRIGRN
jgi:zinc transport system permease protein